VTLSPNLPQVVQVDRNFAPRAARVLVISRSIPLHDNAGGMERAMWDLVRRLSSEFSVKVLTTRVPGHGVTFVSDDISVETVPRTRPGRYSLRWWRGSARFVAELEDRPDVILSVSAGATRIAWTRHSPPCVFQAHGTAWEEAKATLRLRRRWRLARLARGTFWTLLDCLTYRRAAAVVTVGPNVSAALRAWPYRRPLVGIRLLEISNGISSSAYAADPNERAAARALYGVAPDDLVVTSISRLDQQKAVDVYIDAVALANAAGRKVSLIIAGEGPEESALRAQVDRLQVGERVRFVGHASALEVRGILAASDCFLFAPRMMRREGCPLAVLEAWASGLAVITSSKLPNLTGVPNAVRLIDHADAAGIASELQSATTAHCPRPSHLAAEQTLAVSAARYGALLEELVSRPEKARR
jgi:glycosyltransferase involved in cell wall biosynthesis